VTKDSQPLKSVDGFMNVSVSRKIVAEAFVGSAASADKDIVAPSEQSHGQPGPNRIDLGVFESSGIVHTSSRGPRPYFPMLLVNTQLCS
jgi:hypothetical protein